MSHPGEFYVTVARYSLLSPVWSHSRKVLFWHDVNAFAPKPHLCWDTKLIFTTVPILSQPPQWIQLCPFQILLEDSKSSGLVVVLSLVWSYLLRNLDCSGSDGNVKTEEKPLSEFSNTELTVSYWVPLEQAHQELSESPRLAFQGPLEAEIQPLRGECAACGVVV